MPFNPSETPNHETSQTPEKVDAAAEMTAKQHLRDEQDATIVRGYLKTLGLDSIIDVHTHFMPKPVLDKVWAYFADVGPLTGKEWPIAYKHEDVAERLAILRSYGVSHFSSMFYAHKPGMAEWLNRWGVEFAAATPGCLQSATFFPEPEVERYTREAIEAGARVFKAHVQVGAYDPNTPQLDEAWGMLQDAGIPIVIHSGHGPVPGEHTGVEGMRRLLARFPRLTLIIAHMGMPEYEHFLALCDRHERLYLDTTMAFTEFTEKTAPFPTTALPHLQQHGDRVLFGTDFPNLPYGYREAVEGVLRLDLGDGWNRGVLHDNAARLFELEAATR